MATGDYEFSIRDNEYDVVLSAQVIEHVKKSGDGCRKSLGCASLVGR